MFNIHTEWSFLFNEIISKASAAVSVCRSKKNTMTFSAKNRELFVLKRILDIFASVILLVFLIIPIAIIAILVKTDSKGPCVLQTGKGYNLRKEVQNS